MNLLPITIVIFIFSFYLLYVLAKPHFMTKHFATLSTYNDPTYDKSIRFIRYSIKIPDGFPSKDGAVFYGVGGQESFEEMKERFTLFETIGPQFNNPAIIFTEQRFFGNSSLFKENSINKLNDVADFNSDFIIEDNIVLIKKLAKKLKTYSFLLFGQGYSGMLAARISRYFSTDPNLSQFKVLAWVSSIPFKYTQKEFYTISVHSMNKQFGKLLLNECEEDSGVLSHFWKFYKNLRGLKQVNTIMNNPILGRLNLDPIPKASLNHSYVEPELLEFIVFLRNGIRNLAFKNKEFDGNGNRVKNKDNLFKKLCNIISLPVKYNLDHVRQIEGILSLILPNYKPLGQSPPSYWKINLKAGNKLNRVASLNAFIDCTQLQLINCPNNEVAKKDPFAYSSWENIGCFEVLDTEKLWVTECNGLFEMKIGYYARQSIQGFYSNLLDQNAIITMNKDSPYFDSYRLFYDEDNDPSNFAYHFKLNTFDGEEFEEPKTCDSQKMKSVRYLILRAFACFANLIDKSDGICNSQNLFNGIDENDDEQKSDTCLIDNSTNFPFGYKKFNFLNTHVLNKNGKKFGKEVGVEETSGGNGFVMSKLVMFSCIVMFFT